MSAKNEAGEKNEASERPKFKRGAFKPIVSVSDFVLPYEEHGFTHDTTVVTQIGNLVGNLIVDEVRSRNGDDTENVRIVIGRMIYMMMAVKLANSLSPMQENSFGNEIRMLKRFKPLGPIRVMEIIDGFGFVSEGEYRYTMRGQAAWSFTYFCRAVVNEDEINGLDRNTMLCCNLANPYPLNSLKELCIGIIDGWASECGPFNLVVGGANVQIRAPRFKSGAVGYNNLVFNAVKPAQVVSAIRALTLIEACSANPLERPDGDQITALREVGIYCVTWNADFMQHRYGKFMERLIDEVQTSASARFSWGQIGGVRTKGNAWQLSRVESADAVFAFVNLNGGDKFMASAFAGVNTTVIGALPQFRLRSETVKSDIMIRYMRELTLNKQ